MNIKNIFQDIPDQLPSELFEDILKTGAFRIERIVSCGHSSPEDFWYDQNQSEWVILLKGGAKLAFEDGRAVELSPGDYIDIPAHTKHRVEWTDPNVETVWLAIHY